MSHPSPDPETTQEMEQAPSRAFSRLRYFSYAIVGVAALVATFAVGAPYWIGLKTEQRYFEFLDLPRESGPIVLVNEGYERGVFESHAKMRVEITPPRIATGNGAQNYPTMSFSVTHVIKHGPFRLMPSGGGGEHPEFVLALIESRFVPPPVDENKAWLTKMISDTVVRTKLLVGGDSIVQLSSPPVSAMFSEGDETGTIEFGGVSVDMWFDPAWESMVGSGQIPKLSVSDKGTTLQIEGFEYFGDSSKNASGLPLGDSTVQLARASLYFAAREETKEDARRFSCDGLTLTASSWADGERVNASTVLSAKQVAVNETKWGPWLLDLQVRKLDQGLLSRLQQTLREVSAIRGMTPEQLQEKMMLVYKDFFLALMEKTFDVELNRLDLALGADHLHLRVMAGLQKPKPMGNFLDSVGVEKAGIDLEFSEGLFQSLETAAKSFTHAEPEESGPGAGAAEQALKTLTEKKILLLENGDYKGAAAYEGGRVDLNGTSMSLEELMKL